ncbi:hypothetical protein A3734_14390 [Sulfitobacter sp. HI0054]|uniref:glycosyltransferase n=1 Tax=Sulfitobacter sp. HI0054 TaxID=1822238 RepID=UPI0007C361A4|nr:glycosyltransferase [Sulfitobacter sp. HI0054]KZY53808.1 hypothetical protein A3734_14390 [Sulfitobacter sp. HI0054]
MTPKPLKLLHVSPSFFPAAFWGGPIFSTKMICDEISKYKDVDLAVLTTDSAGPRLADRVPPGAAKGFDYPVYFAKRIAGHSISLDFVFQLLGRVRWADVIHLTGTYSFSTLPVLLLARLLGKPVVWSTRGAVQATEEWTESPRRRTKRLFHKFARLLCSNRVVLHVTASEERAACISALPGLEVETIPNGVELPAMSASTPSHDPDGSLRLLYLSRLHPKKGLDRLLDAMDRLPSNVELDIYGGGEAGYVRRIRLRCERFGARVRFHGAVEGAEKRAAFDRADIFVLPTYSENFGIVIAEALAHGVPVLTTTATPWKLMEAKGCGMLIDPHNGDIAGSLMTLSNMDLSAMGIRGRQWMASSYSPTAIGEAFYKVYLSSAFGEELPRYDP